MKEKIKKILKRIFLVIWILIGSFLFITTILAGIRMATFSGSGFGGVAGAIGITVIFVTIMAIFSIYVIITILFLFIKWLIRKRRNNKRK
ncbi:MAG: hypothetical protein M1416_01015 [Candidatus Pacearchaeota archaeon]|nr:hypothetical protein [Candidatus Pacearchaeota archaeon]